MRTERGGKKMLMRVRQRRVSIVYCRGENNHGEGFEGYVVAG